MSLEYLIIPSDYISSKQWLILENEYQIVTDICFQQSKTNISITINITNNTCFEFKYVDDETDLYLNKYFFDKFIKLLIIDKELAIKYCRRLHCKQLRK